MDTCAAGESGHGFLKHSTPASPVEVGTFVLRFRSWTFPHSSSNPVPFARPFLLVIACFARLLRGGAGPELNYIVYVVGEHDEDDHAKKNVG